MPMYISRGDRPVQLFKDEELLNIATELPCHGIIQQRPKTEANWGHLYLKIDDRFYSELLSILQKNHPTMNAVRSKTNLPAHISVIPAKKWRKLVRPYVPDYYKFVWASKSGMIASLPTEIVNAIGQFVMLQVRDEDIGRQLRFSVPNVALKRTESVVGYKEAVKLTVLCEELKQMRKVYGHHRDTELSVTIGVVLYEDNSDMEEFDTTMGSTCYSSISDELSEMVPVIPHRCVKRAKLHLPEYSHTTNRKEQNCCIVL